MSPLAKVLRLLALLAFVLLSQHRASAASTEPGVATAIGEACEESTLQADGLADEAPRNGDCDSERYALEVAEPLLIEAESEEPEGSAPCDERRAGGEDRLPEGAISLASSKASREQAELSGEFARGPPALDV